MEDKEELDDLNVVENEKNNEVDKSMEKISFAEKINKWCKSLTFQKVMTCVAFFSILVIAVMLILNLILKAHNPAVASVFRCIGECLSYIICITLAFAWTRKKKIGWLATWFVAVVLIAVIYIVALAV